MNEPDRSYQASLVAAIRAELGGLGLTQKELAERSGIAYQQIQRYFKLQRDMSVREFGAIAAALDVDPETLVAEARRWRAGTTTKPLTHSPVDPRTLLQDLLDNPDKDTELLARLGEAAEHVGTKSSRAKRLAAEIRDTRSEELRSALERLPSAMPRVVGEP